jgi:hypothetical protein
VSGRLLSLQLIYAGKRNPVTTNQEAGWSPESVLTVFGEDLMRLLGVEPRTVKLVSITLVTILIMEAQVISK